MVKLEFFIFQKFIANKIFWIYHVFDIFIVNSLGYFREKIHTHGVFYSGCIGRRHWSCRGPGRALANSQLSQSSQNKNLNLRASKHRLPGSGPTSAHHFSKFRDEKTLKCNSIIFLVHSFISWTRLIGFTVKICIECIFTSILCGRNYP